MKLCGACFRAGRSEQVYNTHNMTECKFLSREEKAKLFKAAARFLTTEDIEENQRILVQLIVIDDPNFLIIRSLYFKFFLDLCMARQLIELCFLR